MRQAIALQLQNSLTRVLEAFRPMQQGRVKLFTCGPSVYRRQHLGNYRTYLYEDVLHKYLAYLGYDVERCINFTDVEDKAIAEARDKGVSVEELRRPVEEAFFEEGRMLGLWLPETMPRATTSVNTAAAIIQRLIEAGHAYWHEGDVFFDPLTHQGFGRLYGLDMRNWPEDKRRFRKDTYPGRQWNLGDFILWHGRREEDGDVWWDTPLGQGRPGWNIQDPSMILDTLGETVDICCGGVDNLVRHHDYNMAVMEGYSGKRFCHYWLHGEHLLIEGEKMSKSRGNIAYPEHVLDKGYAPRHLRFYLVDGHYSDPLDLTWKDLEGSAGRLERLRILTAGVVSARPAQGGLADDGAALRHAFEEHMSEDLQVSAAVDAMLTELKRLARAGREQGLARSTRDAVQEVMADVQAVLGVLDGADQARE